jgi:predicted TPR repeat methyltransferase
MKYAGSLAFYLTAKGDQDEAIAVLKRAIEDHPDYLDGVAALADIYRRRGDRAAAAAILRKTLRRPGLPPQLRARWEAEAAAIEQR